MYHCDIAVNFKYRERELDMSTSKVLTPQQAMVVGTRMTEAAITKYLDYSPFKYNKETTELFQEICILRGYFTRGLVKNIKFYRILEEDVKKINGIQISAIEFHNKEKNMQLDVLCLFNDFKEAEATVNANYSYGKMNREMRSQYSQEVSDCLGAKFKKIDSVK